MLHAHLALDSPLESFVCYVMACARQNDSTLTMKNKLAGWDAPMSQIVFPTTSALSSDIFVTIWRNAGVHFREGQLFHDLITQTLLRSLQYGIVVMGLLDAFENAHNYHRHNAKQSRKFRGLHGRENPPLDGHHSKIRPCVPVLLLGCAPV